MTSRDGLPWSETVLQEFEFLPRFETHTRIAESHGDAVPTELVDARTVGPTRLELLFRAPWIRRIYGVRLDASMCLSDLYISADGGPLATADVDALVEDLIHLMADEPFGPEDYAGIDSDGVVWRRIDLREP